MVESSLSIRDQYRAVAQLILEQRVRHEVCQCVWIRDTRWRLEGDCLALANAIIDQLITAHQRPPTPEAPSEPMATWVTGWCGECGTAGPVALPCRGYPMIARCQTCLTRLADRYWQEHEGNAVTCLVCQSVTGTPLPLCRSHNPENLEAPSWVQ